MYSVWVYNQHLNFWYIFLNVLICQFILLNVLWSELLAFVSSIQIWELLLWMPKCLWKLTILHGQMLDHSCRLTIVLVVFHRPSRHHWIVNSGQNAPALLERKSINTLDIMSPCAYYHHKTKVANGEKACLQHTRFLHYYDEGKCILKQVLHVSSMCLNEFSPLVLCSQILIQTIGITLYLKTVVGFWGVFHVNVFIECG